jgi:hypothetical protein
VLVWVLAALAVGHVLAIPFDSGEPLVRTHDALEAALDGRQRAAERILEGVNDSGSSLVQFVNLLTIAMLVLVIVWSWRSGHNARALGRTGERVSPTLGIFGWIVPIMCWVVPYLVVQDLWRSSEPGAPRGSEWRGLQGAVLVRAWWVCFAGGQILYALAVGLAVLGRNDVDQTDTLLTVAHTVAAIGAVLTIPVVREITRRQSEQEATDPWVMSAAPPAVLDGAPTVPGEAGWYGDPDRRFEQRYWDGAAWTERVRAEGVQSFAPVVPADWYPDPTGRFPLRYWTGYAWTEHVSRDQELYVDPL